MYAAPGRLVDIGGCRLHIYEQGRGSPTVVLESGIAGSSLGWSLVQPKIAEFTRVCSYDRAGLGWSDRCGSATTIDAMVLELATLLQRAKIPAPFVLVGHSFGGLLIRAYACRRPDEVAGLVFVDPVSLDTWTNCASHDLQRLKLGVRLSRRGAILARLGLVRFALWTLALGGRRLPKLIGRASAQSGISVLERLTGEVRRLPREVWPMVRAHWSRAKAFHAMAAYLECLPAAAAAASSMPIPPNLPFVILSASTATEGELVERQRWVDAHDRGRHRQIKNSGHWVQLEQPEAVVEAVREICVANLAKYKTLSSRSY